MPSKKRNRSNKKSSSLSRKTKKTNMPTSSRKRRRKNAVDATNAKYALDPTIAMIATIALSLVREINPTVATSTGRRERKLDNGKHFRDWKIDPKDFLRNEWKNALKYGLKILEELAELGGKTRKSRYNRVDNRVFRCVTCGHSDYEDGMIVYAIFIQENVVDTLVGRITWVCDYGIRILREYDRRIIAVKDPNKKTAYAMVGIPIEGTGKGGKTRKVFVHALLFNKKEGRGPFLETDHIENSDAATNGLNNLLANVRDGAPDGTNRWNNIHRSTPKNNTSGHKGVVDCKGSNEGGSDKEFGFWLVEYKEFNEDTKETLDTSKSFRRIKNGAAHKQKKFKEACEHREKKMREYVDDLKEYYKPIRALHDRWFSVDRDTQDVVRSFERHWHSLRPSILELTRSSK